MSGLLCPCLVLELNVQNKSTMKVKLKFDSPIDMEDPVVQAAILQQVSVTLMMVHQ